MTVNGYSPRDGDRRHGIYTPSDDEYKFSQFKNVYNHGMNIDWTFIQIIYLDLK